MQGLVGCLIRYRAGLSDVRDSPAQISQQKAAAPASNSRESSGATAATAGMIAGAAAGDASSSLSDSRSMTSGSSAGAADSAARAVRAFSCLATSQVVAHLTLPNRAASFMRMG